MNSVGRSVAEPLVIYSDVTLLIPCGLLPALQVRVLDGNCLDGRQHRLEVSRKGTAAPLPGKALVVFDPQRETVEAMVLCADGHAKLRAAKAAKAP